MERLHGNWPGDIPHVHRWPYDYSKPGAEDDFIPQTVPYSETISSNVPYDFGFHGDAEGFEHEFYKGTKEERTPAKE